MFISDNSGSFPSTSPRVRPTFSDSLSPGGLLDNSVIREIHQVDSDEAFARQLQVRKASQNTLFLCCFKPHLCFTVCRLNWMESWLVQLSTCVVHLVCKTKTVRE